ncbi:MAG: phosphoglycerate kinase [Bacteroidota bacterium]|nr:phosphoglycerate kinase [Bacteroidota bacterium]
MRIDNYDFNGKRALIRVDFNVPFNYRNNVVSDETRIRLAVPTIKKILNDGGSVVLMSHMGRPDNRFESKFSLKLIHSRIEKLLNVAVKFVDDCISKEAFDCSKKLLAGEVLLLENLRFHRQEKEGDVAFAKKLAKHGDVFINDAFGTAHRAHSSTAIIADSFSTENKLFGYLIENEIKSVNKVLNSDERPLTAIVGGAKVSSKISIISRLLDKVDHLIIGGGMAYTFIKANGGEIGDSLFEPDFLNVAIKIMNSAKKKGVKLYLPIDTIAANSFSNDAQIKSVDIREIPNNWMGLDIGKQSIKSFQKIIASSKLILWNGPMGVFELSNFQNGTASVALAVAAATENGAFSLVGGGDSVAAVNKYNLTNKVSHVSTGGGAMLEYLEGKQLPGIKAILN